jgi:hypothetical protein
MSEVTIKLPLNRDILRWVIERAVHEYLRLERGLEDQAEEVKCE